MSYELMKGSTIVSVSKQCLALIILLNFLFYQTKIFLDFMLIKKLKIICLMPKKAAVTRFSSKFKYTTLKTTISSLERDHVNQNYFHQLCRVAKWFLT